MVPQSKIDLYLELVKKHQDMYGFLTMHGCDTLLFTGLAMYAGMPVKNYAIAFNIDEWRWERRPTNRPCWPDYSKSSISRDMLFGPMFVSLKLQNIHMIDTVVSQMNQVIMGHYTGLEGFSRVIPTPGQYATAKIIQRKLEGKGPGLWKFIPAVVGKPQHNFVDHLSGLHLALRAIALGYTTKTMRNQIEELYQSNPLNPLFKVMHFKNPILDLDSKYWPDDRLPTTDDRLAPWLPERPRSSYLPGTGPASTHSGMDLLFCVKIWEEFKKLEHK